MAHRLVTAGLLTGLAAAQNFVTFDDLQATANPGYREIGAYNKLQWNQIWPIDYTTSNTSTIAAASAPNGAAFRFPETSNEVLGGPEVPGGWFGIDSFSFACVEGPWPDAGRPIPCSVLAVTWYDGGPRDGSAGTFDPDPALVAAGTPVPMATKSLHPSRFASMQRLTFQGLALDTSGGGVPDVDRSKEGWVIVDNIVFKKLE